MCIFMYTCISNIGHVRKEEESSGRVNLPASVGTTINRASDNHSGFMVTTDYQVVQGGIFHIATLAYFNGRNTCLWTIGGRATWEMKKGREEKRERNIYIMVGFLPGCRVMRKLARSLYTVFRPFSTFCIYESYIPVWGWQVESCKWDSHESYCIYIAYECVSIPRLGLIKHLTFFFSFFSLYVSFNSFFFIRARMTDRLLSISIDPRDRIRDACKNNFNKKYT